MESLEGTSIMNYSRSQYSSLEELNLDVDAVRQVRYLLCTNVVGLRSRLRQSGPTSLLDPLRRSIGDLHSLLHEIQQEISRVEVALWRLQLRSDDGDHSINNVTQQAIPQEPVAWL